MKSEVDEIIKKILANKGVIGVIILNNDGIPIRSTLDHQTTVQYAGNIHDVTRKGRNKDYTMIVVQNPSEL
ncbi:hypothetical protein KUTeg_019439 [Tegillarca granosa]|uniref:Roadblock/LAMTOR2 domain-containing protein n=1 Tax=Tegillarca granosa TaxID=220873 RepID=A0ABQ9EII1_TEGGR|nr:hypothetical protein KUTeg_019439 [Tegillarca granosa]